MIFLRLLPLPLCLLPVIAVCAADAVAPPAGWVETTVGRDAAGRLIEAWVLESPVGLSIKRPRVSLIAARGAAGLLAERLEQTERSRGPVYSVLLIPDGLQRGYPPQGEAYRGDQCGQHAVWRWLATRGDDLLVVLDREAIGVRLTDRTRRQGPQLAEAVKAVVPESTNTPNDALWAATARHQLAEIATVPALEIGAANASWFEDLEAALASDPPAASPLHRELLRREGRSPRELAERLQRHYGHQPQLHYIPALAVIARLRLEAETTPDGPRPILLETADWAREQTFAPPKNGSEVAGRLLLCELARSPADGRAKLLDTVRQTAELAFDDGEPLPLMPMHSEMSDAVFMSGPLLAEAGRLLDQPKYYDACLRHIRGMQKLTLRDDGLYRHWPGNQAAWGRGNGFPALGIAWSLTRIPPAHRAHDELKADLLRHLRALGKHQTVDGCWRQIIDRPDAYPELTSTCMITVAMSLARRHGWCDPGEFDDSIARAYTAISRRVGDDGHLLDVCTGTGKQPRFEDYYLRKAILGPDPRGGAMALLMAVELAY